MKRPKTAVSAQDIHFATITELSQKLRSREISSEELTKIFCDRLEQLGPNYNALACLLRKDAIKAAKDVDGDLGRQRYRSLIQGIPFGAKDLLSVAKYPTTWGAKPYQDQVFDYDATVVKRLKGKGGLVVAKLAMVELAGGGGYGSASASLQGPGLNPWNKEYWSGGSSSGSGASVAAGLVPYALGSETSGSILTPAAYCGVTGLRPTYGLVSRYGAMSLSWTLDKIGVLARSADDCGHVLQAMGGGDTNDPGSSGKSFYYFPQYARKTSELNFGYSPHDFSDLLEEPYRPVFAKALQVVKSLGAQLTETSLPDFPYRSVIGTIIDSDAASIFETLIRSGRVDQLADPDQINGLKAAMNYSAVDYLKAMRIRRQIMTAFRQRFVDIDVLIAPTRNTVADLANVPFDQQHPERQLPPPPDRPRGVFDGLIPASNLAGFPALSLPCGFVNGLPVAIQLVGNQFSENTLLSIGREFQKVTDFHKQRPPGV
jgi:aspartyl-tRNA(Asn)/glutamyl-tRNA(Gln) amidotransferase subunit A